MTVDHEIFIKNLGEISRSVDGKAVQSQQNLATCARIEPSSPVSFLIFHFGRFDRVSHLRPFCVMNITQVLFTADGILKFFNSYNRVSFLQHFVLININPVGILTGFHLNFILVG